MSAFKIPQMLLVLAKEIFEWCLVPEDIIVLARKIIYTYRMTSMLKSVVICHTSLHVLGKRWVWCYR